MKKEDWSHEFQLDYERSVRGTAKWPRTLGRGAGPINHDGVTGPPRVYLADAGKRGVAVKAAPAKPIAAAQPTFRVLIVEIGLNRLTAEARTAAQKAIEAELGLVTAGGESPSVKAGFQVSWGRSLSGEEEKKLGSKSFVVYLMPMSESNSCLGLAKKHVPIEKKDETKISDGIVKQMKTEGGANVVNGKQNVSFVGTDGFDARMGAVPESVDERARRLRKVGEDMAELILHELGHGMGAKHGAGIMAATLEFDVADNDRPIRHYSNESKGQILRRLESL